MAAGGRTATRVAAPEIVHESQPVYDLLYLDEGFTCRFGWRGEALALSAEDASEAYAAALLHVVECLSSRTAPHLRLRLSESHPDLRRRYAADASLQHTFPDLHTQPQNSTCWPGLIGPPPIALVAPSWMRDCGTPSATVACAQPDVPMKSGVMPSITSR